MRSSWLRSTDSFLDDGLHTAFLNHNFLAFLVSSQHPCQIVQVQVIYPELAGGVHSEANDSDFVVRQGIRIYAKSYSLVFHIIPQLSLSDYSITPSALPPYRYIGLKKLCRKFLPCAHECERLSTGVGMGSPRLWVMRKAS